MSLRNIEARSEIGFVRVYVMGDEGTIRNHQRT